MVSAVLLLATQARNLIYLPDAKLEFAFPGTFTPIYQDQTDNQLDREFYGGSFTKRWESDLRFVRISVKQIYFDQSNPLKLSSEKVSQSLFTMSSQMADLDPIFADSHKQKFTNRQLTKLNLQTNTIAYIDTHQDLKTKTHRRGIAWQTDQSQIFFELSIDSDTPRRDEAIASITDSMKLKSITPKEALALRLEPQLLPQTGFKISAPGPFSAMSPLKGKVPSYSYRLTTGYNIEIKPTVNLDVDHIINLFAETFELQDYERKATKTLDFSAGNYKGKLLKTDYLFLGNREYALQFALSDSNNNGLIGHIIISNDCGGKEKAEAILATFKPI